MSDESTVYFLGAGASADAGIPLTNGLLTRIQKQIEGKRSRKRLAQFIKSYGAVKTKQTQRAPIVDLMSFLDACIATGYPPGTAFGIEALRRIRIELVGELANLLSAKQNRGRRVLLPEGALEWAGANEPRIASYFHQFAKALRPRCREIGERLLPGDAVITTNYDNNIDIALYELVYWEEKKRAKGKIKLTDVFLGANFRDPWTDEHALSSPEAVVDLLKLHGSVNWLYCPKCSRIFVTAFGSSASLLPEKSKESSVKEDLTCFCSFFPVEPVIIAPSSFQEIRNPHLQSIWMNAYDVLENADRWVFAGYSLPNEDLAVRSLLHRALEGRKVEPKVTVVLPNRGFEEFKASEQRYRQVFGKSLSVEPKKFKDYVLSS